MGNGGIGHRTQATAPILDSTIVSSEPRGRCQAAAGNLNHFGALIDCFRRNEETLGALLSVVIQAVGTGAPLITRVWPALAKWRYPELAA